MKHIPRVYIENFETLPNVVVIPDTYYHHLVNVLKIKKGDRLLVFNIVIGEWVSSVTSINKNKIIVECLEQTRIFQRTNRMCLAFGIIKADRLMTMLEKAVELGATDFFPIVTEYTNTNHINSDRCVKIIKSAVEQCGRLDIPALHPVSQFDAFVASINKNVAWFAAIERTKSHCQTSADNGFIVGPEGGFSESEKRSLSDIAKVISLSNNILRTETAAIACLAIQHYVREIST